MKKELKELFTKKELKEIKNEIKFYKAIFKKLELEYNQENIETIDFYLYLSDNNINECIKLYKQDYY